MNDSIKPGSRVTHYNYPPGQEGTVVAVNGMAVTVRWDDEDYEWDEDGSACWRTSLRVVKEVRHDQP